MMEDKNIYTFHLPDIGEGVVEGEVIEWLKNIGDPVKQDEPIVVVMTDKATVELPSPHKGTLIKQHYRVGEVAIKDKPLYDLRLEEGEKATHKVEDSIESPSPIRKSPSPQPSKVIRTAKEKALASPKVRHLAHELDINLDAVNGSGPEGRVTLKDLAAATHQAEVVSPQKQEGDVEKPLLGIRGMMAKTMENSKARLAQFSYFEKVDVSQLIKLRAHLKEKAIQRGIALSFMPFFIRALTLTAKKYPIINSSINMQARIIIEHKAHNIGVAMATSSGLIVPVLKGVEKIDFEALVNGYEALKKRAVTNQLAPEEMKEATITLSNFGVLGEGTGLWATPMIKDPEVAIVATARIRKEPIAKNGDIVVRDILPVSWSFDHRLIDGEMAAAISHHYCMLLRDPMLLI